MPSTHPRKISIFISYSHTDAKSRPSVDSSRLRELLADIKYDLNIHDSRSDFEILRDVENVIRISDDIDEKVGRSIEACDMAMVFLSAAYCRSESCEDELRKLADQGKRIFLIELDEIWANSPDHRLLNYRQRLEDTLGVRFWEEGDGRIELFGYPLPSAEEKAKKQRYHDAIRTLVRDIKSVGREIRASGAHSAPDQAPALPDKVDIVLAAPTSDVKSERDRLERAYLEVGLSVLRLDPGVAGLQADYIRDAASRCHVFAQILGGVPGRALADYDGKPSVIAQAEIAKEAGVETAHWITSDFEIAEAGETYATFLRGLSIHQTSFAEFEEYTIAAAKDKKERALSTQRRAERQQAMSWKDAPLVSIDSADVDADLRDRIKTALERYVIIDFVPHNSDMKLLSETVQDNDAIVLVYGIHNEGQKRARSHFRLFRRLGKTMVNDDAHHFEIAFGDGSEADDVPCPSGPGIHVIRVDENVDPVAMQRFLTSLGIAETERSQ